MVGARVMGAGVVGTGHGADQCTTPCTPSGYHSGPYSGSTVHYSGPYSGSTVGLQWVYSGFGFSSDFRVFDRFS